MTSTPRRRRRHLGPLIAATACAFALVPSATAFAAASYGLFSDDGGAGGFNSLFAEVSGTTAEVPGAPRIAVRRNGVIVAQNTGFYFTSGSGTAFANAQLEFVPAVGDVVEIYNPAGASQPSKSLTYTGRQTLDSCPVGSSTMTGKVDPGMVFTRVGASRPGAQSGDPLRNNPGVASQSGENYTVTLQRPLAAGDRVFSTTARQIDANFVYRRTVSRTAGGCSPNTGGTTGGTTTTPGPTTTTVTPLDGVVDPFGRRDIRQNAKQPGVVDVSVSCSSASTIPCAGTIGIQTVRSFANPSAVASAKRKKKKVTLGTKRFSVAPGATKRVRVKLKKPAVRLLKRQRKLKVRVSAVTKDSAGKRLVTTRTLTLKYKQPKKARR